MSSLDVEVEFVAGMPECLVCLEKYDAKNIVPRMLPVCGHCLCEACIKLMLPSNKKRLACPQCRKDTVPVGSKTLKLESFPKNWALMQCLAAVKDAEEKDKAAVFDPSKFGFEALPEHGADTRRSTSSLNSMCGSPAGAVGSNYWVCLKCTLHNTHSSSVCDICETPRPKRRRVGAADSKPGTTATTVAEDDDEEDATPTTNTVDADSFLDRLSRTYTLTEEPDQAPQVS
eukprot:TRINITY_DN73028_c0_g1_i1.p1 TRINITY_DN73028_c0_g1~~TRINITY_DN73028_c0_g1_i1.p1  ORF type:complete len:230 (+),score=42.67 TRINITY_DN73028_c0_g1_i1:113-802(+)